MALDDRRHVHFPHQDVKLGMLVHMGARINGRHAFGGGLELVQNVIVIRQISRQHQLCAPDINWQQTY